MAVDPLDLLTTAECVSWLAAGGVVLSSAATTQLQPLVTAASRELQRELNRWLPAADYDEVCTPDPGRPDRGEPAVVRLKQYPVNGTPLVYTNRVAALAVVNTDAASNQVAHVGFTNTGDPEVQLTFTGLTLTRVASGVQTADALTWTTSSPYTTVQSLADQVNALGHGWAATAADGLGSFPACFLTGAADARPGFAPGVTLDIYRDVASGASVDRPSGLLSLGWAPPFGPNGNGGWSGYGDEGDRETAGRVRVKYNAGYATVPAELKQAASLMVKYLIDQTALDGTLQSETLDKYTYQARAALSSLPPGLLQRVLRYKSWSL